MKKLISFPIYSENLSQYRDMEDLRQEIYSLHCDGIEGLWGGEPIPDSFPADLVVGYHLMFYPDWLDFYRGDVRAIERKFGSLKTAAQFFDGERSDSLFAQFRADLERAERFGAQYVVFHVSDVSIEEGYTYRWLHSSREVIDASVEFINTLLDGREWPFDVLVENQWWPGFTFTNPEETAYLLDGIHFPRKGIMLDIGHLMNTNTALRTQSEGVDYIHRMLDEHKDQCRKIKGVHLHYTLSGEYVEEQKGHLPKDLPQDYLERFSYSYGHILHIDQHRSWTDTDICGLIDRIAPEYLVHELSASNRIERRHAVETQMNTLMAKGTKL